MSTQMRTITLLILLSTSSTPENASRGNFTPRRRLVLISTSRKRRRVKHWLNDEKWLTTQLSWLSEQLTHKLIPVSWVQPRLRHICLTSRVPTDAWRLRITNSLPEWCHDVFLTSPLQRTPNCDEKWRKSMQCIRMLPMRHCWKICSDITRLWWEARSLLACNSTSSCWKTWSSKILSLNMSSCSRGKVRTWATPSLWNFWSR